MNNDHFIWFYLRAQCRWIWNCRLEIGLSMSVAIGAHLVRLALGPGPASLVLLSGAAVVVGVEPVRRPLEHLLVGSLRKGRWHRAIAAVWPDRSVATVVDIGTNASGEWAKLRIALGRTADDVAKGGEALAACLGLAEIRVRRDPANAALAWVRALRVDPLSGPPTAWPSLSASRMTLWSPIPVGIDDDGHPVTVSLYEHNILVGGEPGSGKSVAVSQIVAAAALDPEATLWLLDGKLVELAPWRPCAHAFAGVPIAEGIAVLRQVQELMDERYQLLLENGLRKMPFGTGLHLVVVDELAHYLTWPERRARDAFTDCLRDLVSRGRAAGIVVVAATQKPAADVVPTSLRDLFGYRWAFRCTTPAASDTILGTGWASAGASAATIRPAQRGVGWLLHESGEPLRLRAHHLDDRAIDTLSRRAVALRETSRP